jgi:hypothetical protein
MLEVEISVKTAPKLDRRAGSSIIKTQHAGQEPGGRLEAWPHKHRALAPLEK